MKTTYSYTCLVGRLDANNNLTPDSLNSQIWNRLAINSEEYEVITHTYYSSLVESMNEVQFDSQNNMGQICKFEMKVSSSLDNLFVLNENSGSTKQYPCAIKSVKLWFFPYKITLFSIEIDDSGVELNNLTLMHSKWKYWTLNYNGFKTDELDILLQPIFELTKEKSPEKITFLNTKIRQYQVVQLDGKLLQDDLLYEIGTHSPVGIIADNDMRKSYKPSQDYFDTIMRENTLSVYSNWKALGLNDTFTILAIDDAYKKSEEGIDGYRFFDMLYMRSVFEEFYCFERNNSYHEGKDDQDLFFATKAEVEIEYMEKYFFYEDISYDFLPSLMYRTMAKGMELQRDRQELTSLIKKALREKRHQEEAKRQRHTDNAVNVVQIFALLSVFWTVYDMIKTAFPCAVTETLAEVWMLCSILITIGFAFYSFKRHKQTEE